MQVSLVCAFNGCSNVINLFHYIYWYLVAGIEEPLNEQ